ncbi:Nn.00g064150.m01.CDS01 [Neocucurbitaria sp. VM-36]
MIMDQRHLPDPTKVGSHGHAGGTLESIMTGFPALQVQPDYIFHLAPMRQDPIDRDAPSSSEMSRKPSIASSSSSSLSLYRSSRSSSPATGYLEPSYDHSPPVNRVAMNTGHFRPYPLPAVPSLRCRACSEVGETIFVEADTACPRCGRLDSKPKATGKAARKKRNDRIHFSRLMNNDGKPEKASKEEGEAGRRYDHSFYFASLQNLLLKINPDFPEVAAQREGKKRPGWTPLKCNNISNDVKEGSKIEPLHFNKTNIFESSLQIIEDSTVIMADAIQERNDLEVEMDALLRSEAPIDELRRFLMRTLHRNWSNTLATSSAQRGAEGFSRPLPQSKLRL